MPSAETYAPKSWNPEHWAVAAPVLRAAVRAGGWGSDVVAYNVLISVAAFVQATWPLEQRDAAPDLTLLLRPSKINLYIDGMVAAGSKQHPAATRRSLLRRTMASLQAARRPAKQTPPKPRPNVDLLVLTSGLQLISVRDRQAVQAGLLTTLHLGASQAERAVEATFSDSPLGLVVHMAGRDVIVHPDAAPPVRALLSARAGRSLLEPAQEKSFAEYLKAHGLTPPRLEALWLTQYFAKPALPSQLVRSLRPNHTTRLSLEAMDLLAATSPPLLEESACAVLRGSSSRWALRSGGPGGRGA